MTKAIIGKKIGMTMHRNGAWLVVERFTAQHNSNALYDQISIEISTPAGSSSVWRASIAFAEGRITSIRRL